MLHVYSRLLALALGVASQLLVSTSQPAASDFVRVATLPTGSALKAPIGVGVVLPDGRIVIADSGNHQLRIVQQNGTTSLVIGSGKPGFRDGAPATAEFNEPSALAVDARGVIYVSDRLNHAIRRVTFSGEVSTLAGTGSPEDRDGGGAQAGFTQPAGLALDAAGNLYVADAGNHKIRRVDLTGTVSTLAGTGRIGYNDGLATQASFAQPEGIAIANDGTLFIADTANHVIRRTTTAGWVDTLAGNGRAGNADGSALNAEFKFPAGLALHPAGDLFVADRGNHRIRRIATGSSLVTSIAGSGSPGLADGQPLVAQLHEPQGISFAGALYVADTRNSAIRIIYPGVQVTSVSPDTGDPSGGTTVRISGSGFVPGATSVMFGSAAATSITFVSDTEITATTPPGTGTVDVQVITPGGTAALPSGYHYGVPFVALSIEPASVTLEVDETQSFTARALRGDGVPVNVTSTATWATSDSSIVEIDQSGSAHTVADGAATVTAQFNGLSATAHVTVETTPNNLPPDPVTTATPTDPSIVTDIGASVKFLYEGPNPVQTGVTSGAIQQQRVGVIRGRVLTSGGAPLSGVRVTVHDHAEFGETLSRGDGWYDIAMNGGGPVTIRYEKSGVVPSQRTATLRWNDFEVLDDVVMTPYDTAMTRVDLATLSAPVMARANATTDQDGSRRATLVVSPGTSASMVLADGTRTALPALSLRATEFTVGPKGPEAMPVVLPPSSAYTYCAELSADEAIAAGAETVEFSQPLYFYVENFMGMPVGEIVPAGYFDRRRNVWVASDNGVVIKIVGGTGTAAIDADGDGTADSDAILATHGFTIAERQLLARTYAVGTELWRAPIRHFSPYDFNFPAVPPPDSEPIEAFTDIFPDDTCTMPGSVIECDNQTLRESIPLAGSAFGLTYSSARVPGRRSGREVEVRLTGDEIHAELRRLDVKAEVAGREFTTSYAAAPNLRFRYEWDGKDAYGRTVYGTHVATIEVTHVYRGTYDRVAPADGTFGTYGIGAPLVTSRTELQQTTRLAMPLINRDDRGKNLGGWSLDIHHGYDGAGSQTSFGDGSTRTSGQAKGTIRTIVGFPFRRSTSPAGCGDGSAANGVARLSYPRAIAGASDGSVYFADACQTLRLLNAAGQVSTVIPANTPVSGGSPTAFSIADITVGPDGSVYLLDFERHRILRREPYGTLRVFAGTGTAGFSGDGGPATAAQFRLGIQSRMTLGPDGSLFIADSNNGRIRRVSTDGRVTTIAGTGSNSGPAADGALARDSDVIVHTAMRAGPGGELYFVEGSRIRMITAEGRIETFAELPTIIANSVGRSGMSIAPGGELYVSTITAGGNPHRFSITRFSKTGESQLIADGTAGAEQFGLGDIYYAGDGGPATAAGYGEPQNIAYGADGSILVADMISSRIRRIALESGLRRSSGVYVSSADGGVLHQFDSEGRHLRTIDALTRVTLYEFTYDAQKRIETVRDTDGRTTSFAYDGDQVTATSSTGDVTALALDGNRYLSSVTSKLGTFRVTHDGQGLLQRFENPRQQASTFAWEANGRLRRDSDAAGGYTEVSRFADGPDGWSIRTTTAEGRTKTYQREAGLTEDTRRVTDANGLTTLMTRAATAAITVSSPTGVTSTSTFVPDFRFGMTAPLLQSGTVRVPSGLTRQITESRTLQLADADALFVNSLTDTVRVNGRTWTSAWTFGDRKVRVVSPAGRVAEQILDAAGRISEVRGPGVLPVLYTYDSLGRPKTVTQGTRTTSYVWNARDELVSLIDPLQRTVTFEYDSSSRLKQQTLPGDRTTQYRYDANGNVVSLTPPARPEHQFGFSSIDLAASYRPPALAGASDETSYRYNRDRDLLELTRAVADTTKLTYDGSGRLATVGSSTRVVTFDYDAAGRLASLSGDTGPAVTYAWDGSLLAQMTWSGGVTGSVSWAYDTDFRPTEEVVNGAPIAMTYDADSLLRSAGALDIQRDPVSGRATGTTLGGVTDSYAYDEYGSLKTYTASYGGAEIFNQSFTRDALDRIATETGTLYGVTSTRVFTYDVAGRLESVTRDGVPRATYDYDANSNRLSKVTPSASFAGTYDVHDRLSTYGDTSYTYTPAGDLLTKTSPTGTTSYGYDSFGNLRTVNLPDGRTVEYVIDGQNRRVGKKINGVFVRGWLYADQLRIVAELDGSGKLISRFVYASRSNVPTYMIRENVSYRMISDHLGSTRLVINTTNGNAAQMIGYDEFGGVLADTAPTFQPFYFAGGLYDADTGLIRFGARDYDPETGRFVSKDPILFAAGDANVYSYAFNDPVNVIDPSGLYSMDDFVEDAANFSAGFGDSLTFGATSWIRDQIGGNEGLDKCSDAYLWGQRAEIGAEVALMGGSAALKASARFASRTAVRYAAQKAIARQGVVAAEGEFIHHVMPLFGHPGNKAVLFPTGGLPAAIHSHRWNLRVVNHAQHVAAHRRMVRAENVARAIVNPAATPLRGARNGSQCGCL